MVFIAFSMGMASAQADSLVIWNPVKVAPQTYKTTIGFRLPLAWETSAGADFGLGSNKGAILPDSQQAMLWGKLLKENITPASRFVQEVSVQVDTLRGTGALLLSRSRGWILSDSFDMETSRSLNIDYDATGAQQASVNASQAVKLIYPWTGTSLSAQGTIADASGDVTTTLGFNQAILSNLNFSASLTEPLSAQPTGDVRLNYQVKW
ncbi:MULTISPECIES: hypothetical protein [unclassified Sinorhizobium]|uniref:hypothetical protein n=1 Tax=unclassified Sinorhizobium TaxID=2613772 RepID=UPI003523ADEC